MYGYRTWRRNEPELRSLYEWIDSQHSAQGGGWRAGLVGAVIGAGGGATGASIGILSGALRLDPSQHPFVVIGPFLAYLLLITGTLIWYRLSRTAEERLMARSMGEMRSFLWKLMSARWAGNIKGLIGEDGAAILNSGAYDCLRCRSVLNSPAWKAVSSDSPWAKAREQTRAAMEITMARLVTMIAQGAPAGDPAIRSLLDDMKNTADEAISSSVRLGNQHGITIDASDELRRALSEMKSLSAADEEFDRLTRGF